MHRGETMSSGKKTLAGSALSVTIIIFVSKAIGFVREMIMAAYFGADTVTDAYNSAYSLFYLPVLLFSSCITSTLVPLYLKCKNDHGLKTADHFCSNTLNIMSLLSLGVCLLMTVFARPLVKLVYPGFSEETVEQTVRLSRIMYPALLFFTAGLVLSSLLNAREKYVAAQLTGLPLSIAEISAAVFFSKSAGITAQAWGVVAAGILQIVILAPFLKGFSYVPQLNFRSKRIRRMAILAGPAVLSMAVNELNHMVDRMLASGLNGGDITSLTYAFKLIMFMMGVIVVPLTTVSFSRMSKQAAKEDPNALCPFVREGLGLMISVALPIVIVAACQSQNVIRFAYGRGAFTEENVRVTGLVFLCYVVGVPFYASRDMLNRVFHAMQDTKTPMRVAAISMAINIVLNILLRRVMGVYGLALATGIAALAGIVQLNLCLKSRLKGLFSRAFIKQFLRLILCCVPVLVVSLLLAQLPAVTGSLRLFLRLCWVTLTALFVYLTTVWFLGGQKTRERFLSLAQKLLGKFHLFKSRVK